MKDRNIEFVAATDKRPSYYRSNVTLSDASDVTLTDRRIRKFLGWTKTEARDKLAELRMAAKRGDLERVLNPRKKKDDAKPTFGVYARSILDSAEWKAKRSAPRNEASLLHLNREFKDYHLSDIKSAPVRQYVTQRIEEGKAAPATTNRELSLLKSILNVAEADEIIPSNPLRGRRAKKQTEANSREQDILNLDLSDEKIRGLVAAAADYLKPILKLALTTGMRRNEMLLTKWKDVNFETMTIRIPIENAKSKKERIVPIDPNLCMELQVLDSFRKKNEYVFMNENGERRKDVRGAFVAACEAVKIPTGRGNKGLVFHDLRHIAAFHLVKVTDIVTASKILGHSDVKMTMRYCHSTETDKREAIAKVAEKLFGDAKNPVNQFEGIDAGKTTLSSFVN